MVHSIQLAESLQPLVDEMISDDSTMSLLEITQRPLGRSNQQEQVGATAIYGCVQWREGKGFSQAF